MRIDLPTLTTVMQAATGHLVSRRDALQKAQEEGWTIGNRRANDVDARSGITVDQAIDLSDEDPTLVWIAVA